MNGALDLLIVDDEQNMRRTLAEILSDDGYDVRVASTGEEAVQLCRDHVFRLILMDVRMPGIDGLEASRQIHAHCKRSRIVLMSAYANPTLERVAQFDGVVAVLKKPLEIESVVTLTANFANMAVICIDVTGDDERRLHGALHMHHFRATWARSVDEALRLADQINYDAMVLDLPESADPAHYFAALHGAYPRTPIVVAMDLEGPNAAGARQAVHGAYSVLGKPFSGEALMTLLEQIKRETRHLSPR